MCALLNLYVPVSVVQFSREKKRSTIIPEKEEEREKRRYNIDRNNILDLLLEGSMFSVQISADIHWFRYFCQLF